jgi:hypothetical protein
VTDAASQLRTATKRAKSDVANKMISMFLHELSRKVSRDWGLRIEDEKYRDLVHHRFGGCCPYCLRGLTDGIPVIEHLDGMNRYRAGLHIPGNVLVSCRKCNSEKRRDDGLKTLVLAEQGWASFLSHDGTRCAANCATCRYWGSVWEDPAERTSRLSANIERIRAFRQEFPKFEKVMAALRPALPAALAKLYSDCQMFAESEIRLLLERF